MNGRHGVPGPAAAWLRVTLPASDAEDILQNLADLYAARLAVRGRLRADIWYWRQALAFGPRVWLSSRPMGSRERGNLPGWLAAPRHDARLALRGFARSPGFTAACVGTLALGIAANTLIYAVVRGAVLRPPPYPDAERLVWVWPSGELTLTHERFLQLQQAARPSADLTAFATRAFAISGGETPDEVAGIAVSPNHFRVFGVPPIRGRSLASGDAVPGGPPVALLSEELWRSHFGADPDIVGGTVDLFTSAAIPMVPGAFTGTPHTVVGILPAGYRPFGFRVDVMTPLVADPADEAYSRMGELLLVGRLASGTTAGGLRARLVEAVGRLPATDAFREAVAEEDVIPLHDALTGDVRPAALLTLGAVLLVLLIACANVASLMLARTHSRAHELDVRRALGAGRGRITCQILTESGLLALASVVLGVVGARLALPAALPLLPPELETPVDAIRFDAGVASFAACILVLTTLAAGLAPALRGRRRGLAPLAGARAGSGGTRGRHRTQRILVVAELALAAMLASGAGLLLKSFARLTAVDTGFEPRGVVTVRVAPSSPRYRDTELRRELYDRVLTEIRALPGVASAGAIHFLPIADGGPGVNFLPDPTDAASRQTTAYRVITPGYLESMRIPLVAGRPPTADDRAGGPPVGLVNRALADRIWPGEDPLGRTLYRTSGREWFTVVGVTGDVRQAALGLPPRPEAYLPLAQSEWASAMTLVVRASVPPGRLMSRIEDIVRGQDPDIPITRTASMASLVDRSVATPRFYSALFSLFAGLALLLGVLGIYGVITYIVRQRTDEIGLRIALGASGRGILAREVLRGLRLAGIGIAVGFAGTLATSRALSGLLYEVSPFDPTVFAAAAVLLGGAALVATLVPARRAARVDPMVAIRRD